MTDTETKLQDAVTQFDLAANTDDEAMVRSCINAMIDMGRSVTLVMQNESGPYAGSNPVVRNTNGRANAIDRCPSNEVLQ